MTQQEILILRDNIERKKGDIQLRADRVGGFALLKPEDTFLLGWVNTMGKLLDEVENVRKERKEEKLKKKRKDEDAYDDFVTGKFPSTRETWNAALKYARS